MARMHFMMAIQETYFWGIFFAHILFVQYFLIIVCNALHKELHITYPSALLLARVITFRLRGMVLFLFVRNLLKQRLFQQNKLQRYATHAAHIFNSQFIPTLIDVVNC